MIPYARIVVSRDFPTASGVTISPYAALGYQYQAGNSEKAVLLTASDGTTFNIGSTSLDRSAGTAGVGVTVGQGNWQIYGDYRASIAGNWLAQEVRGGLRIIF